MSNRIHLSDVPDSDSWTLSELPIDQLELLVSEAKAAAKGAADVLRKLDAAVDIRFHDRAADARRDAGKDTGAVRLGEGDYEVVATLPKKVEWDQKKIGGALDALETLEADGVDMSKLVRVEIKIDERAFLDLAPEHQAILMPARTVKTGKPTYEIKLLAEV